MVSTTSIGIGILIIAVALAVLFLTIRRFGFPLVAEGGSIFGDLGKGLTDFFDRIGGGETTQADLDKREAEADFQRETEEKQKQFEESGFETFEEFERETDPTSIFNLDIGELEKFNPEGIIGFGIEGINRGQGIEDTPQNRQTLFDILQGAKEQGIFDVRQVDFSSLFSTTTQAKPIDDPIEIAILEEEEFIGRVADTTTLAKNQPTKEDPIFITQFSQTEGFEVFSADPSVPVIGVIRETIQDPTQLKVDSFGTPIETASERASRVFEETGDFADVSRGASTFEGDFDFGTNTGSALPTDSSPELSTAEKLKIEAERALSEFDSRSIQNF